MENRMIDEIISDLENIALTAQAASYCQPEQFCEYAYNAIGEVINKLSTAKPLATPDGDSLRKLKEWVESHTIKLGDNYVDWYVSRMTIDKYLTQTQPTHQHKEGVKWRRYPDEKPPHNPNYLTELDVLVKPLEGRIQSGSTITDTNYPYIDLHTPQDDKIYLSEITHWCYESDLLATLPTTEQE